MLSVVLALPVGTLFGLRSVQLPPKPLTRDGPRPTESWCVHRAKKGESPRSIIEDHLGQLESTKRQHELNRLCGQLGKQAEAELDDETLVRVWRVSRWRDWKVVSDCSRDSNMLLERIPYIEDWLVAWHVIQAVDQPVEVMRSHVFEAPSKVPFNWPRVFWRMEWDEWRKIVPGREILLALKSYEDRPIHLRQHCPHDRVVHLRLWDDGKLAEWLE